MPALPAEGVSYAPNTALTVVKQSQIGPFLATQKVRLDAAAGLVVSANYTLVPSLNASLVNWFYPCMTMFALPFQEWVAECGNGTLVGPTKFLADDSFSLKVRPAWHGIYRMIACDGIVVWLAGMCTWIAIGICCVLSVTLVFGVDVSMGFVVR